ncbi:hypothetical protein [Sodalinema gerasimenkoae]|uniref:hypothetical protein n=1 Tax=Sodalinema gerasimenkoae TaxID=2862348 RepID=UPI001356EA80|nr:hypothetical protein [Sodalinema gerasimenkoae]
MAEIRFDILESGRFLIERLEKPLYAHRSIHTSVNVLLAIDAQGKSIEQLVRLTGLNENTLKIYLRHLNKLQLIHIERQPKAHGWSENIYFRWGDR